MTGSPADAQSANPASEPHCPLENARNHPAARAIVAAWRSLSTPPSASARGRGGGRATIVACSGGADSVALAIALSGASKDIVLAHIIHDIRPEAEALADRDCVAELAKRLGVEFAQTSVRVRSDAPSGQDTPGDGTQIERNLEARARRLRYAALHRIAVRQSITFVATAHHADDQLETMLMALVRGAGPRGLAGMRAIRPLKGANNDSASVHLIRPMLLATVTREECRDLCKVAGVQWREDSTNADVSRLRSALRHNVIPALSLLRPQSAKHAVSAAALLTDADAVVRRRAARVLKLAEVHEETSRLDGSIAGVVLERRALKHQPSIVIGEVVRKAAKRAVSRAGKSVRADTLVANVLRPIQRAIVDGSGEPRSFDLAGLRVEVDAQHVRFIAIARLAR